MNHTINSNEQKLASDKVSQKESSSKATENPTNQPQLICTPLSEIQPTVMDWLWENRLPKGTLSIIEGDGGRGKSTIVADICSRLSAGVRLPDDNNDRQPMKILLLAAEDDPGAVLRPRFEAHNATLENIRLDSQAMILNANGLEALRNAILNHKLDVIVIDPIVSFLGIKIDMNRGNDIRSVLGPLVSLARETGCTIIVVRHFNKSREGTASQRGAGSVDFRNAARSVLQIIHSEGKNYLALEKSNYAANAKTLPFSIEGGKVQWGEPCDFSADDLHRESQGILDKSALDEAAEFLKTELLTPKLANEILRISRENGIANITLRRAAKRLGVKIAKTASHWEWSLSAQDAQDVQPS